MSQPDDHDRVPDAGEPTGPALPTRTGGWTPVRPAPSPASPPTPALTSHPPDRSAGPAQWAPQLSPPTPPTTTTGPPVPAPAEPDDDPDRLRPDELPWGVPARALVGADGQLPPATLVARRRSPAAVARLLALVVIAAALVVLAAVVITR